MAYTGLNVKYPLGAGGLNGNRNVDKIKPGQLVTAENIRFDGNSIIKAGGLKLIDSNAIAATPDCLAGHDWHGVIGTQRQVTAWSSGAVYKEVGADVDSVTLVSGLTFNHPVVFVEGGQETGSGNRKLYMYSEDVAPYVLAADGATMSALTAVPSDWTGSTQPSFATYHDFRMWAFSPAAYPHTCYVSNIDDHGDFTSGEPTPPIFQIEPGFGERVSAAVSDIQKSSRFLYIFKYPFGVFRIDTTAVVSLYIPIETVSKAVGCAGPNAVAQVENDIWFIGSNGHIYSLRAVESEQNVQNADLTAMFDLEGYAKDNFKMDRDEIKHARLVYDQRRKEVWVMFRDKTDNLNSHGFVIDLREAGNPKICVEKRGEYFEGMWTVRESGEPVVYCGGTGGVIYEANEADRRIGAATAYNAEWEMPETDFDWLNKELHNRVKRFDWVEFDIIPKGNYNLNLDFIIDGESYRTTTILLGAAASTFPEDLGSFILGGGQRLSQHKVQIGGWGRRFAVRAWNNTVNQDFELVGMTISLKPLGIEGEK
jgi:hypothetical protein